MSLQSNGVFAKTPDPEACARTPQSFSGDLKAPLKTLIAAGSGGFGVQRFSLALTVPEAWISIWSFSLGKRAGGSASRGAGSPIQADALISKSNDRQELHRACGGPTSRFAEARGPAATNPLTMQVSGYKSEGPTPAPDRALISAPRSPASC